MIQLTYPCGKLFTLNLSAVESYEADTGGGGGCCFTMKRCSNSYQPHENEIYYYPYTVVVRETYETVEILMSRAR